MNDQESVAQAPPGLRGLAVADTELGEVRGAEGFYHYRQYDAIELARKRTFEDVWYLFIEGDLLSFEHRDTVLLETAAPRTIPDEARSLLPAIARLPTRAPLSAERIVMSLVGADLGLRPALDCSRQQLRSQCLQLCAMAPS